MLTQPTKKTGFSLIELMITLAVFSIMSLYAVPFFQRILEENDFNTATNTVMYSLNKAKRIASAEKTLVNINFKDNVIQLTKQNSDANNIEYFNLPKSIEFSNQQSITIGAIGVVVNSISGVNINAITNIQIEHASSSTRTETISVTTYGMVAEL